MSKGRRKSYYWRFPWRSHGTKSKQTQYKFPRSKKFTRRQSGNRNPRLRVRPFKREGGRGIIGDFPGDTMGLSRNKPNRNFPDRTKAQDGRLVTLTPDLGSRHFKGKAEELLLEISLAIPWD